MNAFNVRASRETDFVCSLSDVSQMADVLVDVKNSMIASRPAIHILVPIVMAAYAAKSASSGGSST
ncbi:hypothetical protein [Sorangium sp. So ce1335]|uniref:hypothetical protein n=1 Tax=Sorangium sp. So ce1335 TaxID=3133335 RepID=UPI003F5EC9C1